MEERSTKKQVEQQQQQQQPEAEKAKEEECVTKKDQLPQKKESEIDVKLENESLAVKGKESSSAHNVQDKARDAEFTSMTDQVTDIESRLEIVEAAAALLPSKVGDVVDGPPKAMVRVRTKRMVVGDEVMITTSTGWEDGLILQTESGGNYSVKLHRSGDTISVPHFRLARTSPLMPLADIGSAGPHAEDQQESGCKEEGSGGALANGKDYGETSLAEGDAVMVRYRGESGESDGGDGQLTESLTISGTFIGPVEGEEGFVRVKLDGHQGEEAIVPERDVARKLRIRRQKLHPGAEVLMKNTDGQGWIEGKVLGSGEKAGEYRIDVSGGDIICEPFYKLRVLSLGQKEHRSGKSKEKLVRSAELKPGDFVLAKIRSENGDESKVWHMARVEGRSSASAKEAKNDIKSEDAEESTAGSENKRGDAPVIQATRSFNEGAVYTIIMTDGKKVESVPFTNLRKIDAAFIEALSDSDGNNRKAGNAKEEEMHKLETTKKPVLLLLEYKGPLVGPESNEKLENAAALKNEQDPLPKLVSSRAAVTTGKENDKPPAVVERGGEKISKSAGETRVASPVAVARKQDARKGAKK